MVGKSSKTSTLHRIGELVKARVLKFVPDLAEQPQVVALSGHLMSMLAKHELHSIWSFPSEVVVSLRAANLQPPQTFRLCTHHGAAVRFQFGLLSRRRRMGSWSHLTLDTTVFGLSGHGEIQVWGF